MTKYSVHETPQHLNALFTELDACQKEADSLLPGSKPAALNGTAGTSNGKARGSPTIKPVAAPAPAPSDQTQTARKSPPLSAAAAAAPSEPPSALAVARPVTTATAKGSKSDGNAGPVFACRLCHHTASTRDALFTHLYQTGHFVFPPKPGSGTAGSGGSGGSSSGSGGGKNEPNKSWKTFGTAPAPDTKQPAASASGSGSGGGVRSASVASRHGPVPFGSAPAPSMHAAGSGGSGGSDVTPIPEPVEFCYLSRASSARDTPGYLSHVAPAFEFLESAMITGGIRMILTRHRITKDLFVTFRGTKTGVNMLFDVLCAFNPKKAERSVLRTASPFINYWKSRHGAFIRFYTGHSLGMHK